MDVSKYFKRIDTSKLSPRFYNKCEQLIVNCLARGVEYYAISGIRDNDEQQKLWEIGRSLQGDKWTVVGKTVTNARPYTSFHNYGMAVDFCADKDISRDGLQPDWNLDSYKVLQEEAHKLGLISGLDFQSFPEGPHVQLPFAAGATGDFKRILLNEGMDAVWEYALNNLKKSMMYKKYY